MPQLTSSKVSEISQIRYSGHLQDNMFAKCIPTWLAHHFYLIKLSCDWVYLIFCSKIFIVSTKRGSSNMNPQFF